MKFDQKWRLDRDMTLPDWCFGRRYWVGGGYKTAYINDNFVILPQQLPDWFVVWAIKVSCLRRWGTGGFYATIRLGDRAPANVVEALTFERLLKGISIPSHLFEIYSARNGEVFVGGLRQIVESAGRRLCFVVGGGKEKAYEFNIGVQISALTKEVLKWLTSGRVSALL